MEDLLLSGSVVAAFVAGSVALFAPCCISVMLPAYLAGSAHNRRALVSMMFVFASGVATVILPLALGASALRRLILGHHTAVYAIGGLFLLVLAAHVVAGGSIRLPMPGRRAGTDRGVWSIYTLGVFSGAASSCCAPVLVGVVALAGVAESFWVSLILGLAYVAGMVGPLFVVALVWDRVGTLERGPFRPRLFTWRIGRFERTVTGTGIVTGVLLAAMGAVMLVIAEQGMVMSGGWTVRLTARVQHYGNVVADALGWVPGWAAIATLGVLAALAARAAARQRQRLPPAALEPDREPTTGGTP